MTDEQDETRPVPGWRPPRPASEATFVPPPPEQPPQPAWPPPDVPVTAPAWPPPANGSPAWPPPDVPVTDAPPWQPQAPGAQPAAAWVPATAGAPARSTSVLVVLAAIFLLVSGLLALGMGGLLLLGSALFAGAEGMVELEDVVGGDVASALAGIFAVIGGIAFVVGLLEILVATGLLARRSWARAMGLVIAVVGLLVWGLPFLAGLGAPSDAGPWIVVSGASAAGYALTIVALVRGGAHFQRA